MPLLDVEARNLLVTGCPRSSADRSPQLMKRLRQEGQQAFVWNGSWKEAKVSRFQALSVLRERGCVVSRVLPPR